MIKAVPVFIVVLWLHKSHSYSIIGESNSTEATDVFEYVLLNEKNHPCTRTCTKGGAPMVCRYTFSLEWYQTLSKACFDCPYNPEDCFRPHCIPGDGNKRPVLVVNRQMPGPSVEGSVWNYRACCRSTCEIDDTSCSNVTGDDTATDTNSATGDTSQKVSTATLENVCLGDEVIVDVENLLLGDSTTIHWHGHHQRGTPYMDGVPFVTQCPIQPASTFRYHFKADHSGTHFWHSHSAFQRADGAFGAYIVRVPEDDDPHCDLYDYDLSSHIIVILDWGPEIGINKFIAHHHSNGDNKPETLLVNGHGRFKQFIEKNNAVKYTPTARFIVERGYRYRFRLINAEFLNCPIEISVDNHTVTVVSSDGNDFAPLKAESIVTYAGERFDFIINADQQVGLYWMRFRGLMDCDKRFKSAHQVAVLQYKGASDIEYPEGDPDYEQSHKEGLQVNSLNKGTKENNSVNVVELQSLEEWDASLKQTPDLKFYISYDFYKLDNPHYHYPGLYGFNNVTDKKQQILTPQLNHISLKLLSFPLLSGRDHVDVRAFCNRSTANNCTEKYCECTHVLEVPLNSVVELILIDKGFAYDANHPFHLHGYSFRVVSMGKVGKNVTEEEIRRLDEEGLLTRNLINPPKKDTVTVPDGGYTVLRFHATNPGYWLFHCHIEFHVEVGMALVFKIGEHNEMAPIPPNFPQCGNYMPEYHLVSDVDCNSTDNSLTTKLKNWIIGQPECTISSASKKFQTNRLIMFVTLCYCVFR